MRETVYPKPDPSGRNIAAAVQWGPDSSAVYVGTIVNDVHADSNDLISFMFADHAKLARIGYGMRDVLAAGIADLDGAQTKDEEETLAVLLGRQVLDVVRSQDESVEGSLWSTLDRTGVNRLIKLLRKARDAAFGRDE